MPGLTSEGSVAATSTPPPGKPPAVATSAGAAELSAKKSAVTEPPTTDSLVEAQVPPESSSAADSSVEAQVPSESSSAETPIPGSLPPPPQQLSAVPISQLLNEVDEDLAALGGSDTSAKGSEVDNGPSAEPGNEVSVDPSAAPVQPAAQPAQATEVSVRSSSRTRRGRSHAIRNDPSPRRPTRVITATVTARRGTDTTNFTPAVAAISRATNSRKLPANAEGFLKPGFVAVGAQKAWCKMLNVSLSAPAPKEHSPPLDFAFLALMHNVRSSRHPSWVRYDRMPDGPLTFSLGKFVKGVRISIRASGLGGLVRMWRRFSGHCYEDNEKVDLCVALWERRHWLQVSSMDNAIQAFRKASDPRDPFTRVVLSLWADLNRTRNNRADLLRQQFDRLWDWCFKTNGGDGNLPTEVLLEPSYLQYSMEVLEWAPTTEDWSRELRVLDAQQPWRNCWIDAPAEHPYNTTYAPCNSEAPVFVPASMTRQAVISSIAVDQSLADADLVAPWISGDSGVTEMAGDAPSGVVGEASADTEIVPAVPTETAEALDESSFSFAPAVTSALEAGSAATEDSATPTGVEAPAHDAEEPPSDIVIAPFDLLVQIATCERLASE
ncbi:hypothetical protein PHMEG_00033665 [Phytophthora megakarya]|uniref:Uncharacterized protein n=1 Tax=Phytophthora megakarya TaxID=4795 RepID=A0A225UUB9_9STRA|nr:hypothetical protein PHMEG_00033665 [Phytophthora megakarya]